STVSEIRPHPHAEPLMAIADVSQGPPARFVVSIVIRMSAEPNGARVRPGAVSVSVAPAVTVKLPLGPGHIQPLPWRTSYEPSVRPYGYAWLPLAGGTTNTVIPHLWSPATDPAGSWPPMVHGPSS